MALRFLLRGMSLDLLLEVLGPGVDRDTARQLLEGAGGDIEAAAAVGARETRGGAALRASRSGASRRRPALGTCQRGPGAHAGAGLALSRAQGGGAARRPLLASALSVPCRATAPAPALPKPPNYFLPPGPGMHALSLPACMLYRPLLCACISLFNQ